MPKTSRGYIQNEPVTTGILALKLQTCIFISIQLSPCKSILESDEVNNEKLPTLRRWDGEIIWRVETFLE